MRVAKHSFHHNPRICGVSCKVIPTLRCPSAVPMVHACVHVPPAASKGGQKRGMPRHPLGQGIRFPFALSFAFPSPLPLGVPRLPSYLRLAFALSVPCSGYPSPSIRCVSCTLRDRPSEDWEKRERRAGAGDRAWHSPCIRYALRGITFVWAKLMQRKELGAFAMHSLGGLPREWHGDMVEHRGGDLR